MKTLKTKKKYKNEIQKTKTNKDPATKTETKNNKRIPKQKQTKTIKTKQKIQT